MYYNSHASSSTALAAGLVTVVAWGSAFVGIRAARGALSPGPLALGRLLVSTAILTAIALPVAGPCRHGATWSGSRPTACSSSRSTASR